MNDERLTPKQAKEIGRGVAIRRAASMLAHGKDGRGYVDGLKVFSRGEKDHIKQKAGELGEVLRRKTPTAPVPPRGMR